MNILVIGGGGREHAISLCLQKSPLIKKLVVAPGNPGIAKFAECINIAIDDIEGQCNLAKKVKSDVVFIGPELPLVLGLKDKLEENGIKAFGPSKQAAQLEGSKSFARDFCLRHNIPQPKFKCCSNLKEAKKEIKKLNGYCVVKADGLAAGKGVIICENIDDAINASRQILEQKKFGKAGDRILIEERITGIEASLFAVSDGNNVTLIGSAQDHKRAFDNNKGPNTGGMGAVSPSPYVTEELTNKIMKSIILPTIEGMKSEKMPYEGILYAGIMLTKDGPKVIEFNCRFGDPETQVLIPLLKTDLVEILQKATTKNLDKIKIELIDRTSITVVIASNGYPDKFEKNQILPELDQLKKPNDIIIYHAGTGLDKKNRLIATGGRVFSVTSTGKNIEDCRNKVYPCIEAIKWEKGFYRKDIGNL